MFTGWSRQSWDVILSLSRSTPRREARWDFKVQEGQVTLLSLECECLQGASAVGGAPESSQGAR